MFLSKIDINISDKEVIYNLKNSNFWHKQIMSGFDEHFIPSSDARKGLDILHRKEESMNNLYFLVQSIVQPNWYGKSWVKNAQVKCLDDIVNSFVVGKVMNFDVLCSPYYTQYSINEKTGKMKGRRRFFKTDEEKLNWLKEKEKYNGFELIGCNVVKTNRTITNIKEQNIKPIYLTNFIGTLRITDVEKFKTFYSNGVGPHKAYGAGMIMLY